VTTPDAAVAVPSDTEPRVELYGLYDPNLDFRKLALEATYYSKGFRLVDNKDILIGVPHVIIGMTFREGFPREGVSGDYVSIEAVVADKDTLATPPVKAQLPSELAVHPNEAIVYNDSSTGIRRTLVELLHSTGVIDVGSPSKNKDANPFDRPYQQWSTGAERAQEGIFATVNGEPFRYLALRGLRRSDYEWQGQPAHTHYFG